MLDVQYRMHPSISQFPSLEFYNLSLRDGTVDCFGNIAPNLLPPLSSHLEVDALTGHRGAVVFLDHGGSETAKDRSRVNWNEAHIVCSIVEDLLLKNEVRIGLKFSLLGDTLIGVYASIFVEKTSASLPHMLLKSRYWRASLTLMRSVADGFLTRWGTIEGCSCSLSTSRLWTDLRVERRR